MKKMFQSLFALMLAGMVGQVQAQTAARTNPPPVITNSAPVVRINSPADGAKFPAGASVPLIAVAGEIGGTIKAVEFFAGTASLGVVSNFAIVDPVGTPPYRFQVAAFLTWSNVSAGAYSLTAVATDGSGTTVTSLPVNITVVSVTPPPPPPVYPPFVAILNPTNGSTFYSNATVEVCAAAGETNGFVKTVEYFAGDTSLGIVTNYPYATPLASPAGTPVPTPILPGRLCLTWPDVAPGDYVLTAVATDAGGVTATSAPVNITVSATAPPPPPPPTPFVQIETPDNGQKLPAGVTLEVCAEAGERGGSIASIEFFDGSDSLGVVTNPLSGSNSPVANLGFLCLAWKDAAIGAHTLTAVATDGAGATGTSAPVSITVVSNTPPPPPVDVPPQVAILNPTNDASFYSNANICISAGARDPDGYVTTVEFFEGTNSLGVVSNLPPRFGGPIPLATPDGAPVNAADHGDISPDAIRLLPLSVAWSNVAPGDYTLTAVATDDGGLTATSAPVSITVLTTGPVLPPPPTNRPPVVAIVHPEDGAVFFANSDVDICAASNDKDGYVATIEFFAGTTSLGVVTNLPPAAVPRGWHAPLARLNCLSWPSVAPGDYVLTAVATDNQGASTTSAPVSITVSTNLPPVFPGGRSN